MREIWEAIRKHPYVARWSATGALVLIGGYFVGEFIVDPLRDLFFTVLGQRLGITDVTTLAHVVTALILFCIASTIIWIAFQIGALFAQQRAFGTGDTLTTTATVSPTITWGEAFHYLMAEAHASQHNAWSLLENAVKRGLVRTIGKPSVFWPQDGDNSPPKSGANFAALRWPMR
jgi:hypothetical protein